MIDWFIDWHIDVDPVFTKFSQALKNVGNRPMYIYQILIIYDNFNFVKPAIDILLTSLKCF